MKEYTWNRCRGTVVSGSQQQTQLDKRAMELVPFKKWIRSPKWTTTQAVKPWGGWERPAPGVVLNNGRSSIDSELGAMDTKWTILTLRDDGLITFTRQDRAESFSRDRFLSR